MYHGGVLLSFRGNHISLSVRLEVTFVGVSVLSFITKESRDP